MDGKALAEKVKEEADAAEAEYPEDPSDPDEEDAENEDVQTEPEETLPPLSDLDVERAFKRAEKVAARYETQLAAALGPIFADLMPSPVDDFPGYVFAFDPATDIGDAKRAAVAAYFGDDAPDLQDNPDSAACETCEGWGEVLSGAQNHTHRVVACPRCGGTGWKRTADAQAAPTYQPVPGEIVPQSLNANGPQGQADAFGRPSGHPHWGELPAFTGDN